MWVGIAADVEAKGIWEDTFIPVSRSIEECDGLALANGLAGDFDVFDGRPGHLDDRGRPAEDFLCGGCSEAPVLDAQTRTRLGRQLRALYDPVIDEMLDPRLAELLQQLDADRADETGR